MTLHCIAAKTARKNAPHSEKMHVLDNRCLTESFERTQPCLTHSPVKNPTNTNTSL